MVVVIQSSEMDTVTQVQIMDNAVCISHNIYTLGKRMKPTIFPPVGQTVLFKLGMATSLGKEKLKPLGKV